MLMSEFKYYLGSEPPKDAIRLHLNEFQFEHHPDVVKTAREFDSLAKYTVCQDSKLVDELAKYTCASPANILLGSGSDELLKSLLIYARAVYDIRTVVSDVPVYTQIHTFAKQLQMENVKITFGLGCTVKKELYELYAEHFKRGAVVYICSPNNPTGELIESGVIIEMAKKYSRSIFIVDEAYIEFGGKSEDSKVFWADPEIKNVVVCRTFSKAFGLASLRIGYMISPRASEIEPFVSIKGISGIAIKVAYTALVNRKYYLDLADKTNSLRSQWVAEMKKKGYTAKSGGYGNYFLMYVGDARQFSVEMEKKGVYVRNRSSLPELYGYVRITVGDIRYVDLFPKIGTEITEIKYTPKTHILELRKMFDTVRGILNMRQIKWWVDCGTLLGVARHGGIIPWDDDIDIGTTDCLITRISYDLKQHGLVIQKNRTGAYYQIGSNSPGVKISDVHIDVFGYTFDGKRYICDDPRFRKPERGSCNMEYTPYELSKFIAKPWYSSLDVVPVPNGYTVALDRAIGPEWKNKAIVRSAGCVEYPITNFWSA